MIFDQELSSRSTGVPFVRAAASDISIICSNCISDPLCLLFAQNVNDDVGGVIWDCGLLLVDYLLAHFLELQNDLCCMKEDYCVVDLGTGTGVVGIVAAINGIPHCILTDYKAYPVMEANLSTHEDHIQQNCKKCHFVEYKW